MQVPARIGVVIASRNRRTSLLRSPARLDFLGGPPVTVVHNGSTDATRDAVRAAQPAVTVLELGSNQGAVGRDVGRDGGRHALRRVQ